MNPVSSSGIKRNSPASVLVIVSIVQFLTPFLSSAVSIALPQIGHDLSASARQLGLVQVIYTLAVTMLLLPAGRFGDIYGRKKVFIAGTLLTLFSTVIISFSPTIECFILLRLFQGFGAAMINTTSLAILTSVFPASRLGRALGIVVGFVYLGLSAGPGFAGIIVTNLGWRWVFLFMLPLEILALLLTVTRLHGEWAICRNEPFDRRGTVLYLLAMMLTVSGVTGINKTPWSFLIIGSGLFGLILFIHLQQNTKYPLIDIRRIKTNTTFIIGNLTTFICYAASFGIVFLFSLYLQYAKGFSAQATGLIMVAQPVTQAILSPFAGRLSDIYPKKQIMLTGLVCCTAGIFMASRIQVGTPVYLIVLELMLVGVGFGLFSSPNMSLIMSSVPSKLMGTASSVIATMRTQGALVSMAVVSVIITHFLKDQPVNTGNVDRFIDSMRISLTLFGLMGIIGIVCSVAVKDKTS